MKFQDLCEVFTDKLVAKIPSTATGKVTAINFGDDEIIPVGHVMLSIEADEDGEEVDAAVPAAPVQDSAAITSSGPAMNEVNAQSQVRDKAATAPPGN